MFNIIVIGAEDTEDYEFVKQKLIVALQAKAKSGEGITIFTTGDSFIDQFTQRYNIDKYFFQTDWKTYGKNALKYRNEKIGCGFIAAPDCKVTNLYVNVQIFIDNIISFYLCTPVLPQILHENTYFPRFPELGDAFFSYLAYAFTGQSHLVADFLQALFGLIDAEACADYLALPVLETLFEHLLQFLSHTLMVHMLVGAAVIATCHHIYHGVVFIFTKWGIDAHVMSACHDALRDFIFIYSGSCRDFLHARASLVLLFKLVDFLVHLVERTYLVQR